MNNKGFAITTILYGILILFLMLLVSMLGMLVTYSDRLEMLAENANGARDIINNYYKEVYEYSHTGSEQEFVAPFKGKYKLEVWGAQGGTGMLNKVAGASGGYGGYATGIVTLEKGDKLYINVGGRGVDAKNQTDGSAGGYNGGGTGGKDNNSSADEGKREPGSGGGGATHIALKTGLLSSLSSNIDDILIVAGGGGGGAGSAGGGGSGGGIQGNYGDDSGAKLATQTSGNAFGLGGTGGNYNAGAGGGGGGFYGGGGGTGSGYDGAGGSGYIGNSRLTEKKMCCYNCTVSNATKTKTESVEKVSEEAKAEYTKKGNGYARIEFIGY